MSKLHGGFATSVAKLAGGATFAQLVALLAAPILTRLYPPEAFGVAAVFGSAAALLTVVACWRYEFAILLPGDDEEAAGVFSTSLLAALLTAVLSLVAVLIGGNALVGWLNLPELAPYLLLIPVVVLLGGIYASFSHWTSRTRRFGQLSVAQISTSTAAVGTQLVAGVAGFATAGSLIAATVVGSLVSSLVLGAQILRREGGQLLRGARPSLMGRAALRYRKFPLITSWAGILNSASWQLPAFLLAAFFSPVVVGFYALGNRLIRLPMQMVGAAISTVFFQRGAEGQRTGDLSQVTIRVLSYLLKLGVIPTVFLTLMGRDLFVVCFGREWAEAGVYTQLLGPWALLYFVAAPLSTVFSVVERQEKGLQNQAVIFVSRLAALLVGGWLGDARTTIALFGLSGVLAYGFLLVQVMDAIHVRLGTLVPMLWARAREALPVVGFLIVIHLLEFSEWEGVALAALGTILYYGLLLSRDQRIGQLAHIAFAKR